MKNQNEDGTWDITTKLDQESHDQLRSLWSVSLLRRNAENLGIHPTTALRAEMWSYEEYEAAVADAEAENAVDAGGSPQADPNAGTGSVPVPASIGAQQATGTGLGGSQDPTEVQDDGPTPWKEGPRAFADTDLDGKPYEEWKVDQLKAEVAKRNELRDGNEEYADDEPMSLDGLKPDLVQRLTEDDEADAPE